MRVISPANGYGQRRIAASLLLCLAALSACSDGKDEAETGKDNEAVVEAIPVEVARVVRRPVAASYTGTAPLEARAEAQVIAKTSGVALEVLADVGDTVVAGETLVRLDSARAALQAAQTAAQLHRLENQFARSKTLVKEQLISDTDFDQVRFDLENARATNRLAQLELSYANVVAPISGLIAQRSIKPGNFVQINTPIFRIVNISRLEATLNVPERELSTLTQGLSVDLAVDALPGKTFTGTIDRVSPVVDAGSGTFRVVAAFDNKGALQPGMFGRISIDYDRRANALVIPRTALLEGDGGDAAVFALRDGKIARVPVQLGYLDGEWAEIRKGLKLGEQVVVAGKSALRDGSEVVVVGEPANKTSLADDRSAKTIGADSSGDGKAATAQPATTN